MPNEELTNLPDSSQEEIDAANDELEVSKDGLKEIRDTSDVVNILLIGTDTRDGDLDTSNLDQNKVMRSDSMMPVSYTHLDVYKRQKLHLEKSSATEILK